MTTAEIDRVMRAHSQGHSAALLDVWLTHATLCRFRDWVPPAPSPAGLLVDVGCYQPAIGYYAALGWRRVVGVAKEEGEGSQAGAYTTPEGTDARLVIADVEAERLPIDNASADVVLMMEILEHFGLDPMHALVEANRVLKDDGLLILSTPNAAAFAALRRLSAGFGPFTAVEFSGFSTNRHNRLYDATELTSLCAAAGFAVSACESHSYRASSPDWRTRLFEASWSVRDRWTRARTGRAVERGDYLFVRARKTGPVADRYPRWLYFDPAQWPEWFARNARRA